jgi:4-alpha-glucanotransferase
MLGNHDTSSIWQVTERWLQDGECLQQAEYLAKRLDIAAGEREKWIRRVAGDSGELAQAKFADLFIGPAQNIMVFFTDLLGIRQSYNIPGTVSQDNWSLRIDSDYPRQYIDKLRKNLALNIPKALAMALRARGDDVRLQYRNLIEDLESWPVRFQK